MAVMGISVPTKRPIPDSAGSGAGSQVEVLTGSEASDCTEASVKTAAPVSNAASVEPGAPVETGALVSTRSYAAF